jgi:hypothetical protein
MFTFRIIPGVLWLDILDRVTDQCEATLGGFRFPCSILVLVAWMSVLGELRVQAANGVRYITVVYYRPHQTEIQRVWGQWQARLALCALMCGISYYITFEFEDDFPYIGKLRQSILNDRYHQDIKKVQTEGSEVSLMAHVYIQRFLQQAQAIVWVLGTLLRLKRKRFVTLMALVWMLSPLASILVGWCGNYALWLWIGHVMLRFFDLAPEGRPRLGTVGCYSAVLVSTIYWRKYGTIEILLAMTASIGGELAYLSLVKDIQEEKKRRGQSPSMWDRMWAGVMGLFTPDDDNTTSSKKEGQTFRTKGDGSKSGIPDSQGIVEGEIAYTRPSLYSWMAISVYWAAIGIRLDGYDLFTF